jgi:Tol biopolymer transport system component
VVPWWKQIAFSGLFGRGNPKPVAIYVVNEDGTDLARLSSPRGDVQDYSPAWSPDGTRIVYERNDYVNDPFDQKVISMNSDGTSQRRLTPRTVEAGAPAWSADGQRITFVGDDDVYVMGRDGAALKRISPTRPPTDTVPKWSPDGSLIAFQRYSGGPRKQEVIVINSDGSRLVNITKSEGFDGEASWTPDGRILFSSGRDGNIDIYVATATGRGTTNLTNTATSKNQYAAWSSTG